MKKLATWGILSLAIVAVLGSAFAFTPKTSHQTSKEVVKLDPIYSWFTDPSFSSASYVDDNTVVAEVNRLNGLNDGHTYNATGSGTAFEYGTNGVDPNQTIYRQ